MDLVHGMLLSVSVSSLSKTFIKKDTLKEMNLLISKHFFLLKEASTVIEQNVLT